MSKNVYTIEWAHRVCHPETCGHPDDFVLREGGDILEFFPSREEAEEFKTLLEEEVTNGKAPDN